MPKELGFSTAMVLICFPDQRRLTYSCRPLFWPSSGAAEKGKNIEWQEYGGNTVPIEITLFLLLLLIILFIILILILIPLTPHFPISCPNPACCDAESRP